MKKLTFGKVVLRILLVFVTFAVVTFVGAYAAVWEICHGPSKAARDLFVSTILETGQMKFLASWYFSEEEILAVTNRNARVHNEENVNPDLITVSKTAPENPDEEFDINGIEVVEIAGRSYFAKMMIINDPSRVKLSTIYPWSDMDRSKNGETLEKLVTNADCIGGVNGGEYYSDGNWGGLPKGLVVCNGEIQYNVPKKGDVMVGFNEDDVLMIMDIGNMSETQVKQLVEENHIRDAVSFKDVDDGDSNHFTKLIINGTATEVRGSGSGANPRTAIGQREDGTVLLLVTDGRGSAGHLGATAQDLIGIMQEYGAVNAANLDGGSSSAMYYDGAYEMTSVTLYNATSSWRLPTAFVIEKRED
ncbi:MAG: phosphodiester glycosidase family protein [Lachnoclostridium sp.]|nr:phosphodiester glycosidase family protein [Lachnospira sp.]MCM1247527.1 phosphodiester glycosidase family protein [Lachnoclostridium sp.]MCM1536409.1 phosphodiester glycosidase family protein [Clostridium sp.]